MAFLIIALLGSLLAIITFVISHKNGEEPVFAKAGIIIAVSLLTAGIVQVMRIGGASVPETLHYQYVSMSHYEEWDEWIEKTCEECVQRDTTGSCTQYRSYDCSYRDYHPEYWEATTNSGSDKSISHEMFEETAALWGNKKFRDMRRDFYRIDGDAYDITMPMTDNVPTSPKVVGYTTTGSYENRIVFSKSVFNFREIDSTDVANYQLKPWSAEVLMGVGGTQRDQYARMVLNNANYLWGLPKQISMRVIVFWDKGVDAGFLQESYWKGGNKNEFTVCVGVNKDSTIAWAKVISWTTDELMKIQVRDSIQHMAKFDVVDVSKYVAMNVPQKFKRREFKEFSYISLPTSNAAYVVAAVLPILAFIALLFIRAFDRNRRYY